MVVGRWVLLRFSRETYVQRNVRPINIGHGETGPHKTRSRPSGQFEKIGSPFHSKLDRLTDHVKLDRLHRYMIQAVIREASTYHNPVVPIWYCHHPDLSLWYTRESTPAYRE